MGKGMIPKGTSGWVEGRKSYYDRLPDEVGTPSLPPRSEEPSRLDWPLWCPFPKEQMLTFTLLPFVGFLLAATKSPGASVLYMWPLNPQSGDLTHISVALVGNIDYLECNLLIYMKRELDLRPSHPTSGKSMFSRSKSTTGKVVCSRLFIAALSVVVKKRKKKSPVHQGITLDSMVYFCAGPRCGC